MQHYSVPSGCSNESDEWQHYSDEQSITFLELWAQRWMGSVMLLRRSAGFLSSVFHTLCKTNCTASGHSSMPCQMIPVARPPMMPRSPGRGVKIHYTKQMVIQISTTLNFRSFTSQINCWQKKLKNIAEEYKDKQTDTFFSFLTINIY